MSFNLIKREINQREREKSSTLAVRVDGFVEEGGVLKVVGNALPDGETIRISPASWWSKDFQRSFQELQHRLRPGAVMVFANCDAIGRGAYEAASYRTITHGEQEEYFLLQDQDIRIGPMIEKPNGDKVQTVQWAVAAESQSVRTSEELLKAAGDVIGTPRIGHPGAIVRGVDADGVAMATIIKRPWDPKARRLLPVSESLRRFLATEEINISGIGIRTSAMEFMSFIDRFPDATWEVMPLSSLTKKNSDDLSMDYRFHPNRTTTGFMKTTVAGSLDEGGRYRVKAVYPTRGAPLPLAYLHSDIAQPVFLRDPERSPARPVRTETRAPVVETPSATGKATSPESSPAVDRDAVVAPSPEPTKRQDVQQFMGDDRNLAPVGPAEPLASIAQAEAGEFSPAEAKQEVMAGQEQPVGKENQGPEVKSAAKDPMPAEDLHPVASQEPEQAIGHTEEETAAQAQPEDPFAGFDAEIDIESIEFAEEPVETPVAASSEAPREPAPERKANAAPKATEPKHDQSSTDRVHEAEAATSLDDDIDDNELAFGEDTFDDEGPSLDEWKENNSLEDVLSTEELQDLDNAQDEIMRHLGGPM